MHQDSPGAELTYYQGVLLQDCHKKHHRSNGREQDFAIALRRSMAKMILRFYVRAQLQTEADAREKGFRSPA
jgi:hypothetical protein